ARSGMTSRSLAEAQSEADAASSGNVSHYPGQYHRHHAAPQMRAPPSIRPSPQSAWWHPAQLGSPGEPHSWTFSFAASANTLAREVRSPSPSSTLRAGAGDISY